VQTSVLVLQTGPSSDLKFVMWRNKFDWRQEQGL